MLLAHTRAQMPFHRTLRRIVSAVLRRVVCIRADGVGEDLAVDDDATRVGDAHDVGGVEVGGDTVAVYAQEKREREVSRKVMGRRWALRLLL